MATCPICNYKSEASGISCPRCRGPFAFVNGFAGEASYRAWLKGIDTLRRQRTEEVAKGFLKHRITLDSAYACIRAEGEQSVILCRENGSVERLDGVIGYSANVRHEVLLDKDGKVRIKGECRYEVNDLKGIRCVYAGAGATYAVDGEGKMIVRGVSPIQKQVCSWRKVKKLAGNRGRLAALTEDGNVLIADDTKSEMLDMGIRTAVELATTYNFTLWLNADGSVGYSGRETDARCAVKSWKNVKAVAVENNYAVGLTEDGRVLLAGKAGAGFDMERSLAASWTDVIYVACSNSGILGVFADGSVKIVGNVENKDVIAASVAKEIARLL